MKFTNHLPSALSLLLVMSAPAGAADLGAPRGGPRGYEPRPLERSSGYSGHPGIWQGLSVGIDGGYNWARGREAGVDDTIGLHGGLLGAHIGYNWQHGATVIGVETDAAWSNADGARHYAGGDRLQFSNDWLSSFRLKAGVAFGNVLLYATGGVALGGFEADLASVGGSWRSSETFVGYVAGGGIETKLTSNLSARLEGLHYGFNGAEFETSAGGFKSDLSATTVRAGLTYYLNN